MLITTIKIQSRPEKRMEVLQTISSLSILIKKVNGCTNTTIYEDLEDKNTLFLIEEWQSQETLNTYKESKSYAILLGLEGLLLEAPEIKHAVKWTSKEINEKQ